MSQYKFEAVDSIPESAFESTRASVVRSVLKDLNKAPTGIIALTEQSDAALNRLYKSLIQWRSRHKTLGLGIRKCGGVVYVWWKNRDEAAYSKPAASNMGSETMRSTSVF